MASSLVSPLRELHCPLCSLVIAVLVDNFQMALLKGLEKVKLEVPHNGERTGMEKQYSRWGRGGQGRNPGRTEAFYLESCPGPREVAGRLSDRAQQNRY